MDINQIYISIETPFGYKLVKANKLIELENFNIVPAGPDEFYLEKKSKFKKVNSTDIGKYNFANSKIKEVTINNGLLSVKTLPKILVQIYKLIGNSNKIIKNSKLTITKMENGENKIKGREYIKNINISYPKPESNLCVYEIFSQSEINGIKIEIKFELTNQEMIKIKS
jgi:hypothetical protein